MSISKLKTKKCTKKKCPSNYSLLEILNNYKKRLPAGIYSKVKKNLVTNLDKLETLKRECVQIIKEENIDIESLDLVTDDNRIKKTFTDGSMINKKISSLKKKITKSNTLGRRRRRRRRRDRGGFFRRIARRIKNRIVRVVRRIKKRIKARRDARKGRRKRRKVVKKIKKIMSILVMSVGYITKHHKEICSRIVKEYIKNKEEECKCSIFKSTVNLAIVAAEKCLEKTNCGEGINLWNIQLNRLKENKIKGKTSKKNKAKRNISKGNKIKGKISKENKFKTFKKKKVKRKISKKKFGKGAKKPTSGGSSEKGTTSKKTGFSKKQILKKLVFLSKAIKEIDSKIKSLEKLLKEN